MSATYDILSMTIADFVSEDKIAPKYNAMVYCFENSQDLAQGMLDLVY